MRTCLEGTLEELLQQAKTGDVIELSQLSKIDFRTWLPCPTGIVVTHNDNFVSSVTFTGEVKLIGRSLSRDCRTASNGIVFRRDGQDYYLMKYSGETEHIGTFHGRDWATNNQGIVISEPTQENKKIVHLLSYRGEAKFQKELEVNEYFCGTTPQGFLVQDRLLGVFVEEEGNQGSIGRINGNDFKAHDYGVVAKDSQNKFVQIKLDGSRKSIGIFESNTWGLCQHGIIMESTKGDFSLVVVK